MDKYESDLIEQVYQDFLVECIFHVNMEEEKGFLTYEETDEFLKSCDAEGITLKRSISKSEQETLNLRKAYENLLFIKGYQVLIYCTPEYYVTF